MENKNLPDYLPQLELLHSMIQLEQQLCHVLTDVFLIALLTPAAAALSVYLCVIHCFNWVTFI